MLFFLSRGFPFRIEDQDKRSRAGEEEEEAGRSKSGEGKKRLYLSYTVYVHNTSYVRGVEYLGNIHASSGCMALMLGRLPAK